MRDPLRAKGFTLVELLVVIGITAVLMGILLPSLSRAREAGRRVACLSNMRQLGMAMMMYADEHKGRFPAVATALNGGRPEDWIYWLDGRNRGDGQLVRYHGGRFNERLYTCPSDVLENHRRFDNGRTTYPFSYSVNWNIGWYISRGHPNSDYPPRITRIRRPHDKILMIDESWETVDDGAWAPERAAIDRANMLANRHDRRAEGVRTTDPAVALAAGRGNALFCDGHADYISRESALDSDHYDPFKL